MGDFYWACSARTLGDAEKRFLLYLENHGPLDDGDFEDSPHYRYYSYARHELLRVYYLLGRTKEADQVLRSLDPDEAPRLVKP